MAELAAGASPCPSEPLPMRVQGCSLTWGGVRGGTQLAAVGGGDTMSAARAPAGSVSWGVPTSPCRPPEPGTQTGPRPAPGVCGEVGLLRLGLALTLQVTSLTPKGSFGPWVGSHVSDGVMG